MRWQLAVLGALVLASACGSPAPPPPPPAPTPMALPAGVPTAEPGWATAHYWLGNGAKDTETFTTTRPEWRLVWRETTGREALVVTQVVAADSQQVVATLAPGRADLGGSMPVRTPPGRYFLRVASIFADWAIAVEERRS